ncbi:MAG: WD40/YVTN/BNR-like repeat-containing protein, partial [Anaerolineales bacterium]
NGWILADLGIGAGSMAVSVFQTTNGGANWNRVYTNDPNLEGSGDTLPLGGIKVLLAPLDMQTAWIGGVVYSNGTVYLFRTDDGGATWTTIENIELPQSAQSSEIRVEKIRFLSATQGVLVLRVTSANQRTLIFSTDDGGETWQAFPTDIPEAGLLEIPSANEVVFYSSDQFYITEDAGVTFNIINSETSFGNTVTDISFVNSKTGWLVTNQKTLYRTEDGGQTWTVLIP